MNKKAKLIVLCGGEGSGKSTVVEYIKKEIEKFNKKGKVVFTREPGGTPFGEDVRNLMLTHKNSSNLDRLTQFNLAWAQRRVNVKNVIIPSLESGINVISDRFDCCTYAYQVSSEKDDLSAQIEKLFWKMRDAVFSCNNFNEKDIIYIFLDVDPTVGVSRAKKAKGNDANHFDKKEQSFHENVYKGYKKFLNKIKSKKVFINTNKSLEEVLKEIDKKVIENIITK